MKVQGSVRLFSSTTKEDPTPLSRALVGVRCPAKACHPNSAPRVLTNYMVTFTKIPAGLSSARLFSVKVSSPTLHSSPCKRASMILVFSSFNSFSTSCAAEMPASPDKICSTNVEYSLTASSVSRRRFNASLPFSSPRS